MNDSEKVLQIILQEIRQKRITEKDCLIACNINTSFFTDWKKRTYSKPSYDKVVTLANYLGIDLNYLFNGIMPSKLGDLSEWEIELIECFRCLSDFSKGELIGSLKAKI